MNQAAPSVRTQSLDARTGNPVGAMGWVTAVAPLERIPVYLREGGGLTDLRGPS